MSILEKYRHYETRVAVNFVPNFPSEVTRISVNKEMISANTGLEIIVMYMDGSITSHAFNQFEAVLLNIKKESKKAIKIKKVISHEIS